jgi:hypothetical protein
MEGLILGGFSLPCGLPELWKSRGEITYEQFNAKKACGDQDEDLSLTWCGQQVDQRKEKRMSLHSLSMVPKIVYIHWKTNASMYTLAWSLHYFSCPCTHSTTNY